MKPELLTAIASIIIASFAALMAYMGYQTLHKQTKSATLLHCLDTFLLIRKFRSEAVEIKTRESAERYYRELLDLCWTELRLWQGGLLDYSVFYAWMDSRYRSYINKTGITVDTENGSLKITQEDVWKNLVEEQYFSHHDDFILFMNNVFDNKIEYALKKYRRSKLV